MLELLHDISVLLNGGKSYFTKLMLIDGAEISMDITKIPDDARLILVGHKLVGMEPKKEDDSRIRAHEE